MHRGEATAEGQPGDGRALLFGIALREWIKIAVYGLLLVNFAFYVGDDLERARHTATAQWTLLDWTQAFATTLDELAWFVLLLLFELETYVLDDAWLTRRRVLLLHGVRAVCFLFIAHTVYAFTEAAWQLAGTPQVAADLCSLVESGVSFARNLQYEPLTAGNCGQLSDAGEFYLFEKGELVTDAAGLQVERELAWADVVEVLAWLVVLASLELLVRLQDRGVSRGAALRAALWVKWCCYAVLWCIAAYWAWRGHWIFAWDEALWILGFAAIGMNLSQWREEIDAARTS